MSVVAGESWSYQKYKFHGLSLSGIRTAIAMPELYLSFDVAQGFPYLLNLKKFFISHGHLDHAAGIPYIISQKAMTSQNAAQFYMPGTLVEPMTNIMREWEKIEGHQYKFEFIPVNADDEIEINQQNYVKVFPTTHRIESFGYTLFETSKKLRADLQGKSQEDIVNLRRKGEDVNEIHHHPMVTFTGDTQIEFLDVRPWVKKSKILIMESTYLDDRKTIANAREWGHTHLDEIIPRLDEIESEQIVLIHISSRYSDAEALRLIKSRIPEKHQARIVLFPGR
ncbi:MBL fold metallo-hydrolase [Bdellovibrio sp. KM01]|uniref:MBL fold metallo-hydrolase n=1 Tax=Bdellovibrio sp. KM01 TaxID=2748865 RepID=UPI0015EAB2CC|nr:MBL fold metallo-hydrolase [Bdellovibrio sp. KM01]QLY24151.1 MBL fold metallo-hydrolase [Bdellovibrio sp. KM01]